jgi:hypothetical protein
MENEKRGGKRSNAGRKPMSFSDKKDTITLYVKNSEVLKFGNRDKLISKLTAFISDYDKAEFITVVTGVKDFYDAEKIDKIKYDEFGQWQEVELPHEKQKSIAEWVLEKREITDDDIDTYQKFIKRLDGVHYLTEKEKKEIKFA